LVSTAVDDVVTFCFGPHGEVAPGYGPSVLRRAVLSAVAAMSAAGVAALETGMIVVPERGTGAGGRADSDLLSRFVEVQLRRLRRAAFRHYIPATVVNLPPGQRRSADKDAGWEEVAGTDYLPEQLGPGQTWRRRHTRGHQLDPEIEAQLQRLNEAIHDLGSDEAATVDLDNDDVAPNAADPGAHRPGEMLGQSSVLQHPSRGGRP
jgi:hypothetical protein